MSPRLGLIHATLAAVAPVVAAFRRLAPEVTLLHFLDEGLLLQAEGEGGTTAAIGEITRLVDRAITFRVDGILLTCSTFSPAVAELQLRCPVPVVGPDDAMLRLALQHGSRLGVIATVETAAPTTAALLRNRAEAAGRSVEIRPRVVREAFAALKAGDGARHDALVREQIAALAPDCDAIVLAQISMARALDGAPPFPCPVLSSPDTCVRDLLARLSA